MRWFGDSNFTKDAEGRDLFFLWGKLGRGRLVPSKTARVWVKLYLRAYLVCIILIVGPLVVVGKILRSSLETSTVPTGMFVGLAVIVVPWFPLWLWVRRWPVAAERQLTLGQAMATSANQIGVLTLSVATACALVMVGAGLWMLFLSDETILGLVATAFFGFCLMLFLFMWRIRTRA
ncbi:MAG TPA: hypothetical protein PLR41_17490 [Alphaproteobacteria bacterium]|nr:hypothetical protein [Alphaproteobacteria bacterium]